MIAQLQRQTHLAEQIINGGVAQLARACGSYPQCRWFKSDRRYHTRPIGQAVKTPPFHGGNRGSSPLWVTILPVKIAGLPDNKAGGPVSRSKEYGPVVQLVRMPACHAGGRGFEPLPGRHFIVCNAQIAQLVEQWTENPRVAGSIPALGTINFLE